MTRKNVFSSYPQFVGQYLEQLLNPRVWVDKADEMLEASKVIEPQLRQYWSVVMSREKERKYNRGKEYRYTLPPNLHGPYFILVSYGLENLFKAIIVREQGDEIRSEFAKKGMLPSLIKGHNLVELSKKANIEMDIREENVLTRLSRLSKWKSRYPVPVEVGEIQNVIPNSDGKPIFTDYYAPGDLDQISAIVQRIRGCVAGHMNPPS
jgi:hypothetical protein